MALFLLQWHTKNEFIAGHTFPGVHFIFDLIYTLLYMQTFRMPGVILHTTATGEVLIIQRQFCFIFLSALLFTFLLEEIIFIQRHVDEN